MKLAVAEVQSDLSLRATATITSEVAEDVVGLTPLVNVNGGGRCAITLDPKSRMPGQQPYQGIVPLNGERGEKLGKLSEVLEQYMRHSEQLDATLVLAANDEVAAGLLIQRMPVKGENNLEAGQGADAGDDEMDLNEEYNRISTLASSLTRDELLTLDVDTILRRLFWEEKLVRFEPQKGENGPHFACSCSRERVSTMLRGLGEEEVRSVLDERGSVEVGCEFCGQQYVYDTVDAEQLFKAPSAQPPASANIQ